MAHITLSIPDEVRKEMKKHPEIKWSEVARASIIDYLRKRKGISSSKEIMNLLPEETKKIIRSMSEKESAKYYKRARREEWKRLRLSTRTS